MISTVLPTYNRAPLSFASGAGSWLTTTSGERYLDLGAGIAVNSLGHANPQLVEVLSTQAAKLWHVSNLYHIPEQEALADKLVDLTFADTVFFTNSGTEAAELAIKMARKFHSHNGQPERITILTFEGAFHGRSTGAIAAAGSEKMVKGYGPLMPGFVQLPWGDEAALRAAISNETCAVMLEPIQGEGGIRVADEGFLKLVRTLCDETGALMVLDEVQSGVGRSGRLFAHEWAGVSPDIMMVAKGIGGGFPLGAVLATEHAAQGMVAGTHGSTYGGNPLGAAIGLSVLNTVAQPAFMDEVSRKSALLRQGLESLVARYSDVFSEVRGRGLLLGLKCVKPNGDIVTACYGQNLLTVPAADNVLRLLPALNIEDADIAEALSRLEAAAESLQG